MPGLPGFRASDQDLDTRFANDLHSQGPNPDGLIEILNRSQAIVGYLNPTHLRQIARHLDLPDSRVWGTASFYHLFHFDPPPQHSCLICTGTACFVKGAGPLLNQLQRDGVAQHLKQQGIALGTVRCIGTCGGAPLAVIDCKVCNHQNTQTVLENLAGLENFAGLENSAGLAL
jgi:bidirectional [NiFe] hydrogenase diaphorase subunit